MKGIDIKIVDNETGLFITNLAQSKGIEFKYVKFKDKRKTLESAEQIGSVILSKEDFIKLSNYFDLCVEQLNEERTKDEVATVKFFEQRDKLMEEPIKKAPTKKGTKKKK